MLRSSVNWCWFDGTAFTDCSVVFFLVFPINLLVRCFADRFSKQQASIAEQCRRCEETVHSLERVQRERDHASAADHAKLQTLIAETAEEVNRRITQRETKLREEYVDKLSHLEKVVSCYCCFCCCLVHWIILITIILLVQVQIMYFINLFFTLVNILSLSYQWFSI